MPPRQRKRGPAEADLLTDLEAMRIAASGVLVRLALALARRVDSGEFSAADAQQLRLTWVAIREEGRPAKPTAVADAAEGTGGPPGETALERVRRRREERERDGAG